MTEQLGPLKHTTPKSSRPYMPDYGVLDTQRGQGLLPWSWAIERLSTATNYWIATTRQNGQPHIMPVWGIWLDGAFYFSTGRRSRKARNLAVNPRCVICPERAAEPVVLEGIAYRVTDPALLRQMADAYSGKYHWPIEPAEDGVRDAQGNIGPVFAVYPRVVFGFGEDLTGSASRPSLIERWKKRVWE